MRARRVVYVPIKNTFKIQIFCSNTIKYAYNIILNGCIGTHIYYHPLTYPLLEFIYEIRINLYIMLIFIKIISRKFRHIYVWY